MKAITPHATAELIDRLRTLVKEAERALAGATAEMPRERLSGLRARFVAAQERMTDFYHSAKHRMEAGAKRTDRTIRDHPYQALAIAVGIGVLVGVLVGRRTR